MRYPLSIWALITITFMWLTTTAGFAQNSAPDQQCPNCSSSASSTLLPPIERSALTTFQNATTQHPWFKNVEAKRDERESPAPEGKEHEIEIQIEFELDGKSLLSQIPFLKSMFGSTKTPLVDNGNNTRRKTSDLPTPETTNTTNVELLLLPKTLTGNLTNQTTDEAPLCCQPAGGCCARPWLGEERINQGCDPTGNQPAHQCQNQSGCCQTKPKVSLAPSANSATRLFPNDSCCDKDKLTGCTPGCCSTSCTQTKATIPANNTTALGSTTRQPRTQSDNELAALRIENAELKVAMHAAKQRIDLLKQIVELRSQNAMLQAELKNLRTARSSHD